MRPLINGRMGAHGFMGDIFGLGQKFGTGPSVGEVWGIILIIRFIFKRGVRGSYLPTNQNYALINRRMGSVWKG